MKWLLLAYFVVLVPLINLAAAFNWAENTAVAIGLKAGMFALIAAMMAVAHGSFGEFKIDRMTLFVFITFGLFAVLPEVQSLEPDLNLVYAAVSLAATILAIAILRSRKLRKSWARFQWKWIGIGAVISLALRVSLSFLESIVTGRPPFLVQSSITAGAIAFIFLTYLGLAVLEEPAFRGFLWGYLENRNWRVARIWLFQAALFWLAHAWQIETPFQFWLALPVGGLMFGWLVWESKSIAASLVAHAIYNAYGYFF